MKKQLFRGLMVSALATFATGISTFAQADGTPSLDLTVKANLTTGTCSASVVENDAETNTIAFGNVYLSEVSAKSKSKTFVLRFSDCAGLKDKKATFKLAPNNVDCAGLTAKTDGQFDNALLPEDGGSSKVVVDVWTTDTLGGADKDRLHCWTKPEQTVDLSTANLTQPVDVPLKAYLMRQNGTSSKDMVAGNFRSPTTFIITYQ
ncbi:fimbrial protein [Salmonella enterica subsp. salamae]|nr:fimbrial protein [Salmonella enterica subsp. salamae]EEF0861499.1 fimbrial protein [Salmonella enterica subsp. salamae]